MDENITTKVNLPIAYHHFFKKNPCEFRILFGFDLQILNLHQLFVAFKSIKLESPAEVFGIAEKAVKVNPNMQTVIVKRMNRFDKGSADILGIKSSLSTYANNYYEQLWLKAGRPQNIKLVDIDMKVDSPGHLKQLIFGSCGSENYDGVHLRGPGASRHFNYRAKQAIRSTIDEVRQSLSQKESHPTGIHRETYSNAVISANNPRKTDSRTIFLDQKSQ